MEDSGLKKGKLTQLDSLSFKHKLRSMATISKNSVEKDNPANPVSTSKGRNLAIMPNVRPGSLEIATKHERAQSAPRSLISASKKYLGRIPRSRGSSPGAVRESNQSASGGSSSRGSSPTWMQSAAAGLSEEKQKQKIQQAKTSRLYLIRRNGPCSFVVVTDDVTVKHIVKIDEHPSCSCNKKFCVHLLFVYIRVLGVSENDSRIFLDKLRNYEIDGLISAFEKKLITQKKSNSEKLHLRSPGSNLFKMERSKSHLNLSTLDRNDAETKKGQGQLQLGDKKKSNESLNRKHSTLPSRSLTPNFNREITLSQKSLEVEPDCDPRDDLDPCSICLLPMWKEENLLDCSNGCKNQLHRHCLQIWEKACRNRDEAFTCPLCRATMLSEQTQDDPESGNSYSNISLASSSALSSPISEMENFHSDEHLLHILQPYSQNLSSDVITALLSQDERLVPLALQAALKKCRLSQPPTQHNVVLALLEFMMEKSNSFLEGSSKEILELFVLLKNNFDSGLLKGTEMENLMNKLVNHLRRHPKTIEFIVAIIKEATANHAKLHVFLLKSVAATQFGNEHSAEFNNNCLSILLTISSNKHPTYMHQIWSSMLDDVMLPISMKWKEFDRMSRRKVREIISHLCASICLDSEKAEKLVETMKVSRSLSRFVEERIEVERMKEKMMKLQCTLQNEGEEERTTLKQKQKEKEKKPGKNLAGAIKTSPRDNIDFSKFEEGIHWKKGECVGRGGHSTCHVIKDYGTGRLLVVKQIPQTTTTNNMTSALIVGCEEVQILTRLTHPHIVKVFGSNISNGHLNIYQEWMPGGTVTSHAQVYGAFREESLKRLLLQLVDAINYLHCQNVVHRDIKGDNVLLDRWGLNLKLCDFGAAAVLSRAYTEPMEFANQLVGTVCFMAPEVIRGENYGRSCDIWSFGCVVIQMSSAHLPWGASHDSNKAALMYKIGVSLDPPSLESVHPTEARDLASLCLEIDPQKRPGAASLLCHPFFSVSF